MILPVRRFRAALSSEDFYVFGGVYLRGRYLLGVYAVGMGQPLFRFMPPGFGKQSAPGPIKGFPSRPDGPVPVPPDHVPGFSRVGMLIGPEDKLRFQFLGPQGRWRRRYEKKKTPYCKRHFPFIIGAFFK
jgi:hypothetical protein